MGEVDLKITLPEGLARYVRDGVERGFFHDESDVLTDALRRIIYDDARLTMWASDDVQAHAEKHIGMSWKKSFITRLAKREDLESGFVFIDTDEIVPVEIVHDVEELYQDGMAEQIYNFIDYHFEEEGAYLRARCYGASSNQVMIYGPYAARDQHDTQVDAPDFVRKASAYLKRRFTHLTVSPSR